MVGIALKPPFLPCSLFALESIKAHRLMEERVWVLIALISVLRDGENPLNYSPLLHVADLVTHIRVSRRLNALNSAVLGNNGV